MAATDEDFDFEVDQEDLPERLATAPDIGPPSLIVDDLHVTYRVFGAKASPVGAGQLSLLQRLRRRVNGHVGAVSEVQAVRGISFVAHRGEAIGIVGTNGSGKSSLLRAAAGLIPPAKGRVYVSSEPSLLGVNAVLIKQLTGDRNIMIGGLALGLTQRQVKERFDEIVDFAGIGDFVYLPMRAYSSGMAARLRFAISSVATPDILMIDEALSTGDADFRQRSKERIDQIRAHAGTIFLVSHSLATIKNMCTRVLWIDQGKLMMDGEPETVTKAYKQHVTELRARRAAAKKKS